MLDLPHYDQFYKGRPITVISYDYWVGKRGHRHDGTRFSLQEILLSQLTNFLYDDGRKPGGPPSFWGRPYLFAGYQRLPGLGWNAALDTHVATLSGVTRACPAQTPVGGVTVLAFRTSDNAFVGSTVSDMNGNYSIALPIGPTYYLVAYLTNAPDLFGTTPNTLTPV